VDTEINEKAPTFGEFTVYSANQFGLGHGRVIEKDNQRARLTGLLAARFFACASSFDWMACALTIARISPGKRCSSSMQRDVLWTSTPRRSPRISPASLSSLKC
jgi:hypothetical protein